MAEMEKLDKTRTKKDKEIMEIGSLRKRGVVSSLNFSDGYGMITVLENPVVEYFFHATDMRQEKGVSDEEVVEFEDLNTGDVVEFLPLKGKKGWKGLGVELVNEEEGK